MEPVPAAGAVQGMDSEYTVPLAPVPVVGEMALVCSMIGMLSPEPEPPPGVFCTYVGSVLPHVPACVAEPEPPVAAVTVAS